jgi:hypothetical protein
MSIEARSYSASMGQHVREIDQELIMAHSIALRRQPMPNGSCTMTPRTRVVQVV